MAALHTTPARRSVADWDADRAQDRLLDLAHVPRGGRAVRLPVLAHDRVGQQTVELVPLDLDRAADLDRTKVPDPI
jgi:hypothetical protein